MLRTLFRDLAVDRLRTTLTGLSMLLGILAIITSVLVGSVGKEALVATSAQRHGRPPTYSISLSNIKQGPSFLRALANEFRRMDDGHIALSGEGESIAYSIASQDAQVESTLQSGKIIATTENYRGIYILPLVRGRWLSADGAAASLEVVGNKMMFPDGAPATVALRASSSPNIARARVVGVVNDGLDQPVLYLNLLATQQFAAQLPVMGALHVQWNPSHSLSAEQIKGAVTDALFNTVGGEAGEVVRIDSAGEYEAVIEYLEVAFFICALLLLLVSVIGLINIGLASIEQRTHELLIRRAIGASRRSIGTLVLGSMLLLSLFVAGAAIVLAWILVAAFPVFLPPDTPIASPGFPVEGALIASAAAISTALLGSIAPAVKAMRLEPALALR